MRTKPCLPRDMCVNSTKYIYTTISTFLERSEKYRNGKASNHRLINSTHVNSCEQSASLSVLSKSRKRSTNKVTQTLTAWHCASLNHRWPPLNGKFILHATHARTHARTQAKHVQALFMIRTDSDKRPNGNRFPFSLRSRFCSCGRATSLSASFNLLPGRNVIGPFRDRQFAHRNARLLIEM